MIVKAYHICPGGQICYIYSKIFNSIGINDDTLEYIIFIFKADCHPVILLYLRKPTGDFITPWKNSASDQFCPPQMLF